VNISLNLVAARMARGHAVFWSFAVLLCVACLPARAQDIQFLPEIDAHLQLNSTFCAYLEAKDDREGGDPTQFTIGPSLQFYVKPFIKLKRVTLFDLDEARREPWFWKLDIAT
jgi:hypothetical protein